MANSKRRQFIRAAAAAPLAVALGPRFGHAQSYPSKPVRLINPFAAGGSVDVLSRLVAQHLSEALGQPVVVENRAGAGGTVGADSVAKSAPDGYSLIVSNVASHAIGASLYAKLPYDPLRDFEHIGMFGTLPNALLVNTSSPVQSLHDLVKRAKAEPGKLTYGSAGNGSTPHLSAELLKHQAGIDVLHVPYKGAGPALQDLLGGQISFLFENIPTVIAQQKGGKIRVLGTTGAKRSPMLPDVPTLREQGLPQFVVETWHGISAPAGTPRPIVERLSSALRKVLTDEGVRKRLMENGVSPVDFTPDQYRAHIAAEIEKWREIVKVSGAKVG